MMKSFLDVRIAPAFAGAMESTISLLDLVWRSLLAMALMATALLSIVILLDMFWGTRICKGLVPARPVLVYEDRAWWVKEIGPIFFVVTTMSLSTYTILSILLPEILPEYFRHEWHLWFAGLFGVVLVLWSRRRKTTTLAPDENP